MSKRLELTGLKFNRLTVIGFSHMQTSNSYWKVLCDCGTKKTVSGQELKNGGTKSCGCLLKDVGKKRRKPKQLTLKFGYVLKGEIVKCNHCEKEFYKSLCYISRKNFCSKACHHKHMDKKITLTCEECGIDYRVSQSYYRIRGRRYCSRKCTRLPCQNVLQEKTHWATSMGKRIKTIE